ncbi:hypothetical protein SDC9_170990 [bioreactor metagenome]|uniref:Uncharacterized protein n=1 Tax=bioreactor metagenome TaxID=1076179 RepID=A0A645G9M4_9ZZZZ
MSIPPYCLAVTSHPGAMLKRSPWPQPYRNMPSRTIRTGTSERSSKAFLISRESFLLPGSGLLFFWVKKTIRKARKHNELKKRKPPLSPKMSGMLGTRRGPTESMMYTAAVYMPIIFPLLFGYAIEIIAGAVAHTGISPAPWTARPINIGIEELAK